MQYTVKLQANIPQRVEVSGRFLMIEDTGAAPTVALTLRVPGSPEEELPRAKRGHRLRLSNRFDLVTLLSTVAADVSILVSDNAVEADFASGSQVLATIQGLPLPVSNDRGSPGNLMHVTAVTAADTPATGATAAGPVAVGDTGAVVATANANTRELRLLNLGPDPVAIGPAGGTWAQRVLVLEVGDVLIETRGANLAWSGITATGKAASVNVQRVNA